MRRGGLLLFEVQTSSYPTYIRIDLLPRRDPPGMTPATNPFAVLSFIVAPAVLTNASSVLAMSTTNRLARAVDRARELSKQLEETTDLSSPKAARRVRELDTAERRTLMLLIALRSFYIALGCFASATLFSLLGAVLAPLGVGFVIEGLQLIAVAAGLAALAAIMHGSTMLIHDTRLAVRVVQERADLVRARIAAGTTPERPPLT
jgi:hypothetical protein